MPDGIADLTNDSVQDFYDVWQFHADIELAEIRMQETEVVDVKWVQGRASGYVRKRRASASSAHCKMTKKVEKAVLRKSKIGREL